MKNVLVNKPIHPDALKILQQEVNVLQPALDASQNEVFDMLSRSHGVIVILGLTVTRDVVNQYCGQLEVVGRHGVGIDSVDFQAVTENGIPLVYTPWGPTESTAEHTFLLMLAVAKNLPYLDREIRSGHFEVRNAMAGIEMQGKTIGIAGAGRIGSRVAHMCKAALDMRVLVYDPPLGREKVEAMGYEYCDNLLEMAKQADVLTVHTPLLPETRHMINREVFSVMKRSAIVINAARGPIIDEAALYEALKAKQIRGAGVDVYDPEPPSSTNPLYTLENIVLTPHMASFTEEGRRKMGVTVAEDVLRVLRGEMPKYLANPDVLKVGTRTPLS